MLHYYIESCGRVVSDFDNKRDALEYIKKFGGELLIEERDA